METFSPKDKVVDIIKEYPTTRILFDEVSMGHRTKRILRIERKEYQTY